MIGVGAVVVEQDRVLLVRRANPPLQGQWSLPGGLVELGESLRGALLRELEEETGLVVEPLELIELVDRIDRDDHRVRYHYVLADYLCRVIGGSLRAATDADAVRWAERAEWNESPPQGTLSLDAVTARVIEKGWQRAQALREGKQEKE